MVCGLISDDITIWSDPSWAIAGEGKISIYVSVENATLGGAISGATVKAIVEDSSMGEISPATQKTNKGVVSQPFTFTPSTLSGETVIRFTIDYTHEKNNYHLEKEYLQPIDHAKPYALTYLQKTGTVPVGTSTDLIVQFSDVYGNPIDSRYEDSSPSALIPEQVTFTDSVDKDGGFWDGSEYVNAITVSVNDTGYSVVSYRVPTASGDNIISIRGPAGVNPSVTYLTIKGIGTTPTVIRSTLNPANGVVYADNKDVLSFLYTVLDSQGNPVPGLVLWRTTSLGETERFVTNKEGKVLTVYGPRMSTGVVYITATVDGYPLVSVTDRVEFIPAEAMMWELTASPQTLASRDVNPAAVSEIRVKVMDPFGNPVEGELVSFSLLSYTNNTCLTILPSLEAASALSDADGYAIVKFLPGGFPGPHDAGFSANATGTALVGATWNGRGKTIPISFRNYPYLRVETEVSPMTIGINETINVTVRLIGDGYALISKPVDVVMVIDRSGSMERNQVNDGTGVYITRMEAAKRAAGTFLTEMKEGKDRVGLVSYSYENDVRIDAPLSSSFTTVKTRIDALQGSGGTAMREGFRKSIEHLINDPNPKAVQAVILMTDGNWNNGGSPLATGKGYLPSFTERDLGVSSSSKYKGFSSLARHFEDMDYRYYDGLGGALQGPSDGINVIYTPAEYDENTGALVHQRTYRVQNDVVFCSDGQFTNQNMSIYAKNNGIVLYTISFAQNVPQSERESLDILAKSTGGFYRHAPTIEELSKIYREIAQELQSNSAAVDTEMLLSFDMLNVTYNNLTSLIPGRDVFTYQYVDGVSTYISSWNNTLNPLPGHVPSYPYTVDQSADWQQNPPRMDFSIGNISVNQTWETTFRLVVKVPGNINIFGAYSDVWFGGGDGLSYHVPIPASYVTVVQTTSVIVPPGDLLLKGISPYDEVCMGSRDLLFQWTLNYTGNHSIRQKVYYQRSENGQFWGDEWVYLTAIDAGTGPFEANIFSAMLDTINRVGYFKIKVDAEEDCEGGLQDEWISSPSLIKTCGSIKIS